jgi:hypothetical protein
MTQWRDRSEPSDLGLNSRQTLDLSRVARGLNLTRRVAERKSEKEFVSGREGKVPRFDATTREGASCEQCERKVNLR